MAVLYSGSVSILMCKSSHAFAIVVQFNCLLLFFFFSFLSRKQESELIQGVTCTPSVRLVYV
jgi:hypothetical protein